MSALLPHQASEAPRAGQLRRRPLAAPIPPARASRRTGRLVSAVFVLADLTVAALAAGAVSAPAAWTAALVAVAAATWQHAGLYRCRLSLSILDDLPALLRGVLLGAGTALALGLLLGAGSLLSVAQLAAVLVVAVPLVRAVAYAALRQLRRRGRLTQATLVLGAGKVGCRIVSTLQDHAEYGLRPVAFADDDPWSPDPPVPVLCGTEDVARVVAEHSVETIVIAFSAMSEVDLVRLLRDLDRLDCEVYAVPRLFELQGAGSPVERVWSLPLVRVRRHPTRRASWRLKRAFDVCVSGIALLLLAPVLAAASLAVRLDGAGPIIFRQERIGAGGRPYTLLKFRSLRPADESEAQTTWSIAQDDRVSPIGRFLRATSLDELPQLLNVLRGDMTLVGPRPERPHFVDIFCQQFVRYADRHRVPVGLTGWAAVQGLRGDTSIEERVEFDNAYIESWSLWLDIKVMLRTVPALFRRSETAAK